MKAGGNGKCREFFEGNGQPWKSLPITEKVSLEMDGLLNRRCGLRCRGHAFPPAKQLA